MNNNATLVTTRVLASTGSSAKATSSGSKAKKRKIAETSNVITESLPSVVESEKVEIEVEMGDVVEAMLEEVEHYAHSGAARTGGAHAGARASSDDSALALLADITSKYRPGETGGSVAPCTRPAGIL